MRISLRCLAVIAFFLWGLPFAASRANEHAHDDMHAGMSVAAGGSVNSAVLAEQLAYKKESEFNHHLVGLFVLIAGLFLMADGKVGERGRYAWPLCFLLSGFFVLVFSDTELWPFGSQSWYFGLTQHKEVLQHKVFAVLLLALGFIELQRVRGALKSYWFAWVFPAVAAIGSLMLFVHEHRAGMHGPNHIEIMERIQSQHFSFAMTGFGIALSKGLAETPSKWRAFFERLFPTLLIVLGALLLVYVE